MIPEDIAKVVQNAGILLCYDILDRNVELPIKFLINFLPSYEEMSIMIVEGFN